MAIEINFLYLVWHVLFVLSDLSTNTKDRHVALGIQIVNHDPIVERFLGTIAEKVGSDLPAYRNHIYRVLTYASHFLGPD